MATRIPDAEFRVRMATVRARLGERDADAAVWFDATSIEYLTGFHHVQTERPVVLCLSDERCELAVPRLELERVESNPRVDDVHTYFDYPGGKPMETVASMLSGVEAEAVLADMDGAPGVMGYEGPPLSDFVDVEDQAWVPGMREAKSEAEIALVRESANWGNLAHRHLADLTEVGAHPATVSQRASTKASRAMLDALGSRYQVRVRGDGPVALAKLLAHQHERRIPHDAGHEVEVSAPDVALRRMVAVDAQGLAGLVDAVQLGHPRPEQPAVEIERLRDHLVDHDPADPARQEVARAEGAARRQRTRTPLAPPDPHQRGEVSQDLVRRIQWQP